MDKHFPKGHPLNKIFNRNCVKMSYRCTANLGSKIAAHNAKILQNAENEEAPVKECTCRVKNAYPVQGKCLSNQIVYQALVKRIDGVADSYVGLTENSFKDRWTKHKSSFRTRNPKNATALSRYVWKLMDEKTDYDIEWKILSHTKPYNPGTGVCRLCLRDKFYIWFKPEMSTINSRNKIAGPCVHKASKLFKKS